MDNGQSTSEGLRLGLPRCNGWGVRVVVKSWHNFDQRGGVLVECAIIIPLLVLVVGGIVDLAILMRESDIVIEAARHGARLGAAQSLDDLLCIDGGVVSCACVSTPPLLPGCSPANPVERTIAESACEYLAGADFNLPDWKVSISRISDALDQNVFDDESIPVNLAQVRVIQDDARKRCLFCWQAALRSVVVKGESTFELETDTLEEEMCP